MWDVADPLPISAEQRRTLEAWIAARNSPQKVVFRSRLVLMPSTAMANRRIAQDLNTSRPTVILWRQRFLKSGPAALTEDAPGRGRKPQIATQKIKQIVDATSSRSQSGQRAAHLGCARTGTASHPQIQALPGQTLRGEVDGCGGPVSESSRQGVGAVCG